MRFVWIINLVQKSESRGRVEKNCVLSYFLVSYSTGWKFTIFNRKNFVLKFLGKMFSSYSPTLTLCLTLKSDYVLICTYFSDTFLSHCAEPDAVGSQKSFDVC